MGDIKTQLRAYLETTPEVTFDEIMVAAAPNAGDGVELVRPRPQQPGRWRGPLVAAGTAAAIVVVVAAVLLVLRGGSVDVSDTPVPVVPSETTVPLTVAPAPTVAGPGGVVTVVVTDLTDAAGNDLAGVLMSYNPASPDDYKWDGVAGFAVAVDADPFSTSQPLGEVTEASPEDWNDGMWPWPTGTARVPDGDYTLRLFTGKDYCCYSRWVPAAIPGLRDCELRVSTTGQDQTIYVTDIPYDGGPCTTDPATAVTGTVTIELGGVAGLEGYRLLAGVWSETVDPPLVGAAFWTIIDSDLFSDSDRVHPPIYPNPDTEIADVLGWAVDDYFWGETAQLEPGRYQIDLWANPGELAPYGSHIPASPIERTCTLDVDVTAGQNTTVVITGIPADGEPCETATELNS